MSSDTERIERHSKAVFAGVLEALADHWRKIVFAIFLGSGGFGIHCDAVHQHSGQIQALQNRVSVLESNVNLLKGKK